MALLGRVQRLWRYPVKSMGGESLPTLQVEKFGVTGDRAWALRDEQTGEIRGAKKFPPLMKCKARYPGENLDKLSLDAEITLPSGEILRTSDQDINAKLSQYLNKQVTLHALRPAQDVEHYRRRVPLDENELRDLLGRDPDEPLPDLSTLPADVLSEITEYTSPRGTYFDAYPIHLLTTSWLQALSKANPHSQFDALRFRPNIVIENAAQGHAELDWCDNQIRIGSVIFNVQIPTVRCGMTTHATAELPADRQVLRTIVQESAHNVGVYATVESSGKINVGDEVEMLE